MRLHGILKSVLLLGNVIATTLSASSDWTNINGGIFYRNNTLFQIKGLSWFGAETCDFIPHGLWSHPMSFYLDFMEQNEFNVLRFPISEQLIKNGFDSQHPADPGKVSADPSLQGKTTLEIVDQLFDQCAKRGIFVLLDMHRLKCEAQSHELWYTLDTPEYTADTFFASWQKLIDRYASHPAFHGIDLLNEPRGMARWGNDPSTSWNLLVESAFSRLNYDGLIYVEGTDWGHDLSGVRDHPIRADPSRIVFSPHVYGPSVVGGNMDLDTGRLHAHWNSIFGYLVPEGKSVVIGEFGGRYWGADKDWQDKFVDYLVELRVPGIYWSMNPNSGDTGGVLADDWTTPVWDKLALVQRLQPTPTRIIPASPQGTRRHLRTSSR